MQIAILGGTGDIGEGLALRWAYHTDHSVVIGSRDPDRAERRAAEYEVELDSRGREVTLAGTGNPEAAADADVVVLAVPPYYVDDTIEAVAGRVADRDPAPVLVTPAVGMNRDEEGFHYAPPPAGSVAEHAAAAVPDGVPFVGAFHNLAADRLANLDVDLDVDTLVFGDDPDARETVVDLAEAIEGLRALETGGLATAPEVESLTPLVLNIAASNEGFHDVGVRFR